MNRNLKIILATALIWIAYGSTQALAQQTSQYDCTVDYSAATNISQYSSCVYPQGSDVEPLKGVGCQGEGEFLQVINGVPTCSTAAQIEALANQARNANRRSFNALTGSVGTECRTGYCTIAGTDSCAVTTGSACPSNLNRQTICPGSCGGCNEDAVYCVNNQPVQVPNGNTAACQLRDDGTGFVANGGLSCEELGRAVANPCTGECTACSIGYTLSGRSGQRCVPNSERFMELFSDGLNAFGGQQTTLGNLTLNNAYLYGTLGDNRNTNTTDNSNYYGSTFLEADQADHLNWSSTSVPGTLFTLAAAEGLVACDQSGQCQGAQVCTAGFCNLPSASSGSICNTASECPLGYACTSGTCSDMRNPNATLAACIQDSDCAGGLVCSRGYCHDQSGVIDSACVNDSDCAGGLLCEAGTNICRPNPFYTISGGGSSVWNQSGSDINYTAGNVGIGTATPVAPLEVAGEVVFENRIRSASGNARGLNSVDLQTARFSADRVAQGNYTGVLSGRHNRAVGNSSVVVGGYNNAVNSGNGSYATIIGGTNNLANTAWATVLGGNANVVTGMYGVALGSSMTVSGEGSVGFNLGGTTPTAATLAQPNTFAVMDGVMGIGTVTPAYDLDVAGQINGTELCIAGVCQASWPSGGGSSLWTQSGANLYYTAGNIGIGTTTPASALQVNGDAVFDTGNTVIFDADVELNGQVTTGISAAYDTNTTSYFGRTAIGNSVYADFASFGHVDLNNGSGYALLQGATGAVYINSAGGQSINFRNNNGQRMIMTPTGEFGIGTAAPAYKLDVAGQANATELCIAGVCQTSWPSGSSVWSLNGGATYYDTGAVGIQEVNPVYDLDVNGDFRQRNGWSLLETVGIGTTTPTHPLDVRGAIRNDVGGNYNVWLQGGSSTLSGDNRNAALVGTSETTTDRLYLNYLGEYQGGTYINGGVVGVGTDTATSRLHVQGFVTPFTDTTAMTIDGDSGASDVSLKVRSNSAADAHTDADTDFIVTGSGLVGIGTSTPNRELSIYSADTTYLNVSDATREILMGVDGNGGIIATMTNHNMHLRTNNVNRMTITTTGSVGIGTTSPQSTLDVNGSIRGAYDSNTTSYFGRAAVGFNPGYTADYAAFSHVDQNSAGNYAVLQNNLGHTFLNSSSGQDLSFRINNLDQMVVSSSGNVGIGTASPAQKLDVNGNTIVRGNLTVTGNITNLSVSSIYSASTFNGGAIFPTTMTSTTQSICYLTKNQVQDVDDAAEYAGCEIASSGGSWLLYPNVSSGVDADVWCEARCLSW